jgi:hypothetical protein
MERNRKEVKGKLKGHYKCSLKTTTPILGLDYCPFNFQAVKDCDNFLLTSKR